MPKKEPIEIQDEIAELSDILWNGNSLQDLILDSITSLPVAIQNQVGSLFVTSGGNSNIPGFNNELKKHLLSVAPHSSFQIVEP
jgi:actin-related protein